MLPLMAPEQDPRMSLKNILHYGEDMLATELDKTAIGATSRKTRDAVDEACYLPAYHRPSTAGNAGDVRGSSVMHPAMTPSPTRSRLSSDGHMEDHWDVWQVQSSNSAYLPAVSVQKKPRAPRPCYSEEQKFYIMFCRVMLNQSWPDIEERFSDVFGGRTKGGLTSIYYRVRKDWGLGEVLKSGPQSIAEDCREIKSRAANFSKEFLAQIGYFKSVDVPSSL